MRRTVLLLLLLAPELRAQESPEEALAKARARLADLEKDESEEGKRWRSAISKRIAQLEEQAGTAKERAALPDAAALETRKKAGQAELVSVLDRQWELRLTADEVPDLAQLLRKLPKRRHEEAKQAFLAVVKGANGLLVALRAEREELEQVIAHQGELLALYRQGLDTLKRVVDEHPRVAKRPAPQIRVTALGASGMQFMVCAFVPISVGITTLTELYIQIYEALRAEGIVISYPRQDLRIIPEGEPGSP